MVSLLKHLFCLTLKPDEKRLKVEYLKLTKKKRFLLNELDAEESLIFLLQYK